MGLLASLRAANTIEKTEFADIIESPDTALWKLAIVSMLANDGLIVFSTAEGDIDAEHIQSDISVQQQSDTSRAAAERHIQTAAERHIQSDISVKQHRGVQILTRLLYLELYCGLARMHR